MTTTPYVLTKLDIAALRKADYLCISIIGGVPRVRATKRKRQSEKDPFAQDVDYILETPATAYATIPDGAKYHALVYLYQGEPWHAPTTAINQLKAGDEVTFRFYANAHSNQYMEQAGYHGDILQLLVKRGEQRMCFDIDHSNGPDNSARMCQGAVNRKEYSLA